MGGWSDNRAKVTQEPQNGVFPGRVEVIRQLVPNVVDVITIRIDCRGSGSGRASKTVISVGRFDGPRIPRQVTEIAALAKSSGASLVRGVGVHAQKDFARPRE